MKIEQGLSVLSFDGAQLAFPLSETVTIQRSAEFEPNHGIAFAIASVVYAERRWPVFRLNAAFEPSTDSPSKNTYCVCLSADDGETGVALVCDTIEAIELNHDDLAPVPLPTCMQRDATPLQQIFLQDDYLLPVSTAPALATYLRSLMNGGIA